MYSANTPRQDKLRILWAEHGNQFKRVAIEIILVILMAITALYFLTRQNEEIMKNRAVGVEIKRQQDSLVRDFNASLQREARLLLMVDSLYRKLDTSHQTVVNIRNYYENKIDAAGRYTDTQLDSFVTARYGPAPH